MEDEAPWPPERPDRPAVSSYFDCDPAMDSLVAINLLLIILFINKIINGAIVYGQAFLKASVGEARQEK